MSLSKRDDKLPASRADSFGATGSVTGSKIVGRAVAGLDLDEFGIAGPRTLKTLGAVLVDSESLTRAKAPETVISGGNPDDDRASTAERHDGVVAKFGASLRSRAHLSRVAEEFEGGRLR